MFIINNLTFIVVFQKFTNSDIKSASEKLIATIINI